MELLQVLVAFSALLLGAECVAFFGKRYGDAVGFFVFVALVCSAVVLQWFI
jgi:hypothetical protein